MSDQFLDNGDGETPLSPDEREGLIPSYISLRRELNAAEQQGILDAERWAYSRRRNVLDESFLRQLHHRMFKDVWRWAGKFRTTGKNIGVEAWKISTELHLLLEDVRYWIDNNTYSSVETAARFHHRLVCIHLFPNGNGRHARIAADLLMVQLGGDRLTWGRLSLSSSEDTRRRYIDALRSADMHNMETLTIFIKS